MPTFWGYPPPPHDPKSKEDKVKSTNLKNLTKFQFFYLWNKLYTWHTFRSCLIWCANMKWIPQVLLKKQSRHDSVHRQTDGQTDGQTDEQTMLKRGVWLDSYMKCYIYYGLIVTYWCLMACCFMPPKHVSELANRTSLKHIPCNVYSITECGLKSYKINTIQKHIL